jgi:predicted ATPase
MARIMSTGSGGGCPQRYAGYMLHSLRIENFHCFRDHSLSFGDTTVVVGKNNSGKSTVIEALEF